MKNSSNSAHERIFLEGMTSVSALINACRSSVNRRNIISVLFDKSKQRSDFRRYRFLSAAAEELGFQLRLCDTEEIDNIASGHTHGGIISEVTQAVYPELTAKKIPPSGFAVIMEGLEDPYSLGTSIRSLYACGADMLILPRRLPTGADVVIARSSAGTSELLPIFIADPTDAAILLRDHGYKIIGAGIRDSVECCNADLGRPLTLVVGGEKRGISSSMISQCTQIVRIPYGREFMGSLSSAASVSILAYEVMRCNRSQN